MIDIGLLATIAVVVLAPTVFLRPWPPAALPGGLLEHTAGPLMIGVVVGRLTSMALDDPSSITTLRDIVIIRSGVEFWAGAAAGIAWIIVRAVRNGSDPVASLAAISVPGIIAWALYEATCVLRDGCPGPVSAIGLRPDGLHSRMIPVGILVAVAALVAAVGVRRVHRAGSPDIVVVLTAVAVVATIRAAASIWLPHVGAGPTRQHLQSIVVAVGAACALVVMFRRHGDRSAHAGHVTAASVVDVALEGPADEAKAPR